MAYFGSNIKLDPFEVVPVFQGANGFFGFKSRIGYLYAPPTSNGGFPTKNEFPFLSAWGIDCYWEQSPFGNQWVKLADFETKASSYLEIQGAMASLFYTSGQYQPNLGYIDIQGYNSFAKFGLSISDFIGIKTNVRNLGSALCVSDSLIISVAGTYYLQLTQENGNNFLVPLTPY